MTDPIICLISAMSENRVIGKDNSIPWKMPVDMKFFRQKTTGNSLIIGRKTYESFGGKPLPNRRNIVITRDYNYDGNGAEVVHDIHEALELVKNDREEVFIGGGEQVYRSALAFVDRIYLTTIHADIEGDVFFPEFPEHGWIKTREMFVKADDKNQFDCTFRSFDRLEFED